MNGVARSRRYGNRNRSGSRKSISSTVSFAGGPPASRRFRGPAGTLDLPGHRGGSWRAHRGHERRTCRHDLPRRLPGDRRLGERAPHLRAERRRTAVRVDVHRGVPAADADFAVRTADLPAVRDRGRADAVDAKLDLELVVEPQDRQVFGFDGAPRIVAPSSPCARTSASGPSPPPRPTGTPR